MILQEPWTTMLIACAIGENNENKTTSLVGQREEETMAKAAQGWVQCEDRFDEG